VSIYKRVTNTKDDKYRYLKDGKFVSESAVPMELKTKFDMSNEITFDDSGDKRCLFGDAPAKRIKNYQMEVLDLCEWHYQNSTLGAIAHEFNLMKGQT
jgi:hypothetical protein